jgi:hypothetical protein
MALAFGAKLALPHPFVALYTSVGVPNCGGKYPLRFGNKVVLCDKKMVRVHEWKLLADRVAGAAQNAIGIGDFARAIANCRNWTNKVFIFGRASIRLRLDSCHDLMKVTTLARNFLHCDKQAAAVSSSHQRESSESPLSADLTIAMTDSGMLG